MAKEVEIKFKVNDARTLTRDLRRAGFKQTTPSTHEINDLYDLPGQKLRKHGDMLRLRKFGDEWSLTHKAKEKSARHKSRVERETKLEDGKQMEGILCALGFQPTFRYEKYRAEWSDGKGHVVVDETPIGNFGEIEGSPRWIDRTAGALGLNRRDYITQTYAPMFFDWKKRTRSSADEMTFRAVREAKRRDKKRASSS